MTLPYSDFNRGAAQQPPLEAAGQRIAASVCYEDAYGVDPAARVAHRDDAGERHQRRVVRPFHARATSICRFRRMRAMEAGRPMVRAANDGVSAVIGHRGEIVTSGAGI